MVKIAAGTRSRSSRKLARHDRQHRRIPDFRVRRLLLVQPQLLEPISAAHELNVLVPVLYCVCGKGLVARAKRASASTFHRNGENPPNFFEDRRPPVRPVKQKRSRVVCRSRSSG